tara:strand:- start:779 stop:1339 length:561 start_codon:yes stop_codon:yes gene_type:complete
MFLKNLHYIKEGIIPISMCDNIVLSGENMDITDAKIEEGNQSNRKSKVSWLDDKTLETSLNNLITIANNDAEWNFSLSEFEPLQYTIYNPGDHYDWHIDSHSKPYANGMIRKLSFTICLTDDYTGGEFELSLPSPKPEKHQFFKFDKVFKKGTMIVFPSHIWHKVHPVLTGTRKVLVGWIVGKSFV